MSAICPYCTIDPSKMSDARNVIRFGGFSRKSDGAKLRRFRCLTCRRTFSEATQDECFRQHKRQLNALISKLLTNTGSQRGVARMLEISRTTVERKLLFLARQAPMALRELQKNNLNPVDIQFDDLETFEHSKCKPLVITLVVETGSRVILDFEISQAPPKGRRLAAIAKAKYGDRKDQRKVGRAKLLLRLSRLLNPWVLIRSDAQPHYGADVKQYFPLGTHIVYKSKRCSAHGQGELKNRGFDPLFSINHTLAMLRANINRLIRSTWCTTKKRERLEAHLLLYVLAHNSALAGIEKKLVFKAH